MNIGRKKLENEVKRMEMEQKISSKVENKVGLNLTKCKPNNQGISLLIILYLVFVDFGSVFSTLLPSTMEKLESQGCNYLDGLEVRVTFGSVWK
ncbi:hypothetical protein AAG906_035898 [Vitis piasezkii]